MQLIEIKKRDDIQTNKKLRHAFLAFSELIEELRNKKLPETLIETINQDIETINNSSETSRKFRQLLNKKHTKIIVLVKKELRLIPKNHYLFLFLVLGMPIFGFPIGIVFGLLLDNITMFAVGFPVGMSIGIILGFLRDNKVKKEGRQLNIENPIY